MTGARKGHCRPAYRWAKPRATARLPRQLTGPRVQSIAMNRQVLARIALALLAGVVLLIAWAWADGGREPLRPIAEPVELPPGFGSTLAEAAQ